jgi:ribosomal protein L16 Arg81 hydroxylase
MDFAQLLWPLPKEDFLSQHWEKKHLLIERGNPRYYDALFSKDDVDRVIANGHLASTDCRVAMDGTVLSPSLYLSTRSPKLRDKIDPDRIYGLFNQGATIILEAVDRWCRPLADMGRKFENELTLGFQANVYFTPPNALGFGAHFDTHDVFILQIYGRKLWRLYESSLELPLVSQKDKLNTVPDCVEEFYLNEGDVLYIPRGVIHDAPTDDHYSLHITVGIIPFTWSDLLSTLLLQASHADPNFRKSLPIGFRTGLNLSLCRENVSRLFSSILDKVDVAKTLEDDKVRFITTRNSRLNGHLNSLLDINRLTLDSTVGVRHNGTSHFKLVGDSIVLAFPSAELELPAFVEPHLTFMAQRREFQVKEMPDDLDDESKLVLARRLIKESYLEIARL